MRNSAARWLLFGTALSVPTLPSAFPRGTPISLYSSSQLARKLRAQVVLIPVTVNGKALKAAVWKFDDDDQRHSKRTVHFHFYQAELGSATLRDATAMFDPFIILDHGHHVVLDNRVDDDETFYVTIAPKSGVTGVFLLFGSYDDRSAGEGGGDFVFDVK